MVSELKVLDRMRASLRIHQFNINTEKAYMYWARAFVEYHNGRDPVDLGREDVESFLNYLATERYAAAQTRNQALHAVLFLYKDVIGRCPDWLNQLITEHENTRKSNILSKDEVQTLLSNLFGQEWLMVSLVYGAGMRASELVNLRVRDIDFENNTLLVRQPNGDAAWKTILPQTLSDALKAHLEERKLMHIKDVADGLGEVHLPASVEELYPRAARAWGWQFVFPETERKYDPESGNLSRHSHIDEKTVDRAIERAAIDAQIYTRVTATTLRNSFAVHMIRAGVESSKVEALLGHGSASGTEDFLAGLKSPLDTMRIH